MSTQPAFGQVSAQPAFGQFTPAYQGGLGFGETTAPASTGYSIGQPATTTPTLGLAFRRLIRWLSAAASTIGYLYHQPLDLEPPQKLLQHLV